MKNVFPFLKFDVEKDLKSKVVYQIRRSRYSACYIGQTDRHLTTHFKEQI